MRKVLVVAAALAVAGCSPSSGSSSLAPTRSGLAVVQAKPPTLSLSPSTVYFPYSVCHQQKTPTGRCILIAPSPQPVDVTESDGFKGPFTLTNQAPSITQVANDGTNMLLVTAENPGTDTILVQGDKNGANYLNTNVTENDLVVSATGMPANTGHLYFNIKGKGNHAINLTEDFPTGPPATFTYTFYNVNVQPLGRRNPYAVMTLYDQNYVPIVEQQQGFGFPVQGQENQTPISFTF